MKRHIATLSLMAAVALGITAAPATAQDRPAEERRPGDPAQRIERRLERLDEKLDLTDAQEQQIRQALEEKAREVQEHFTATRDEARQNNREALREYLRTQLEETDRAIVAALTPEQQEQYTALKAERPNREQRGNRDRGLRAGQMRQGIQRFAQELDLTDAQQEQVEQLFSEQHQAVRTWMESNPDASREERRAFVAERMTEGNAQLESVLNADQLEKYRSLREDMQQKWEERREQRGERRGQGGNGDSHQHENGR